MKINVHYIRHGESEANIAQQERCGTVGHLLMRDPQLTKCGMETSKALASTAPRADVVISSELLRAIQTALYMYPNRFVHVVPYLNELGGGYDNLPWPPGKQNEILGRLSRFVVRPQNQQEESILEYIKKYVVPRFAGRDLIDIALCTHSRLLRNHLDIPMSKLENNCVHTYQYDV